MRNNDSLNEYYREQLSFYPRLSQEEIVDLYKSEDITNEPIEEIIEKLKQEISKRKEELASPCPATSLFDENTQKKMYSLQRYVEKLEIKVTELENLHIEIISLSDSEDTINSPMEQAILKLKQEISVKKEKIVAERELNETVLVAEQQAIDELEIKVEKLEKIYKDKVHSIYISTRGIIPRNRKFPSKELRNKVVCGNLGLAGYLARKYFVMCDKSVPINDLVQIAFESLISAAHYYIPSDQAKFSTYAAKCMQNKLKHEIWSKNKMKKRPYKPKDFFEKEEDRMKYIQMFFESLKYRTKSGKLRISHKETDSVILHRMNKQIIEFNRDKRFREEASRMFKKVSSKNASENLHKLLQEFFSIMKDGKVNVLINNDERDIISLLVNYEGITKANQELYQTYYYLQWYLQKLDSIKKYFEIEQKLSLENDGITPTEEEILEEFNKQIKDINKERYHLRQEGFFSLMRPSFKVFYDYYNEYLNTYSVDFFQDSDPSSEHDGIISRKKEKDEIASEYEEFQDRVEESERLIEYIENNPSPRVILFFSDDNGVKWYEDYEDYSEEEEIPENAEVLTKLEAIDKLKEQKGTVLTEEDYVKTELKKRAAAVNAILREKNAPIIEKNREIKKQIDMYDSGKKFQNHLKPRDISTIKHDIELLFGDDAEILLLSTSGRENRRRQCRLSTEEEALDNLFLEDYHRALEELPELERRVMQLYYDETGAHSMKAKEIGAQLDISDNKVYKAKTKALKLLSNNQKIREYNEE